MPSPGAATNPTRSTLAALGAYLCWGLFPLFWKHLAGIDAFELIAHRHLWSLVTVAVLLGEPLSARQAWALVLAAAGVGVLIVKVGHVPWIALGIVATWAGYSLLKKKTPLAALPGFALETLLLAPVALAFLAWLAFAGRGALGHVDTAATLLILSSGVVTTVPLLLFAEAARHLRLTTLGLLQYLVPTCQFLLGWLVYREPFTADRAFAFALIWAGLALYGADLLWRARKKP